jgi:pilus assembly protein Flp/PilA
MVRFYAFLQSFIASHENEDEGATMVEYGLIVAAIALVVYGGAQLFGNALSTFFSNLVGSL